MFPCEGGGLARLRTSTKSSRLSSVTDARTSRRAGRCGSPRASGGRAQCRRATAPPSPTHKTSTVHVEAGAPARRVNSRAREHLWLYSRGPVGDFEISSTISPTAFSFASTAISACANMPTSLSSLSTTGSRRTC